MRIGSPGEYSIFSDDELTQEQLDRVSLIRSFGISEVHIFDGTIYKYDVDGNIINTGDDGMLILLIDGYAMAIDASLDPADVDITQKHKILHRVELSLSDHGSQSRNANKVFDSFRRFYGVHGRNRRFRRLKSW